MEGLGGEPPPRPRLSEAPAKVNLFLHVTGRREDGYHLLDSLAVFAGVHDIVSATPAGALTLEIDGLFGATLSTNTDNLVLRAAQALRTAAGTHGGARLVLTKNLPVASGIGGGSADAAATLRVLRQLWRVAVPQPVMTELAVRLGADVPVCIGSRSTRMGGIGEVLGEAPSLPEFGLVLVNPGVAVSTPAVFAARKGGFSASAELPNGWSDAASMAAGLAGLGNDLEQPAVGLCPAIGDVLQALRGTRSCLLARMSGSGATCFGLYPTVAEAKLAAEACQHDGWWCWGGAPWGFASVGPAPY